LQRGQGGFRPQPEEAGKALVGAARVMPLNNLHEQTILVAKATFRRRKCGLSNGALNLKSQDFLASMNDLKYFKRRM
jgi:hypothetical protein